jgi:hypothetical protein
MKQGRADSKGPTGQKVEPNSQARSPAGVSYIGYAKGNHAIEGDIANPNYPSVELGNGYNPSSPNGRLPGWDGIGPGAGRIVRSSGTQGKY